MPGSDTTPSLVVRGCLDTCSPPVGTNYVIDCCTTDFCNKAINIGANIANVGAGNPYYASDTTLPTLVPLATTTPNSAVSLFSFNLLIGLLVILFVVITRF